MKKRIIFALPLLCFALFSCGGGSTSSPTGEPTSSPTSQPTSEPTSTPTSTHVHTYDMNNWTYDENSHWHAATCEHTDLKIDVAEHELTDWADTADGGSERHCVICEYVEEKTIEEKFDEILKFELNDDGESYKVVRDSDAYSEYSTIYIPEKHCDKPVTVIGEWAFTSLKKLHTVVLPSTIIELEDYAFYWCTALRNIEFGKNLKTIGQYAFVNCWSLLKADLSNVESIGKKAFSSAGLIMVTIDKSTQFGENVFSDCHLVYIDCLGEGEIDEEALFPTNSKSPYIDAGKFAFDYDDNYLYALYIDANLTIEKSVLVAYFGEESDLEIPATFHYGAAHSATTVNEIGSSAFMGNAFIQKVTIPYTVELIADFSFAYCPNLEEVIFPTREITNVELEIGGYAFIQTGLRNLRLTDTIVSIGDCAFKEIELESISFSDSLRHIGSEAFWGTTGFIFEEKDGVSYKGDEKNPYLIAYHVDFNKIEEPVVVKFADGCRFIDYKVCSYRETAFEIVLPDGLIQIGEEAFLNSSGLMNTVDIPSSVLEISEEAFVNCTSITSVILHEGLLSIGESAFFHCESLKEIRLPRSITYLGGSFFGGSGKEVYYDGTIEEFTQLIEPFKFAWYTLIHCNDGDFMVDSEGYTPIEL